MTEVPEAVVEKAVDAAIAAAPSFWLFGAAQKDLEREKFGQVTRAALQASPLMEVVEALRDTKRELWFCAQQLASHGRPGAKGDSVDRALSTADAALAQFAPAEEG